MALLGHSWGAQLALQYALEPPDRVSEPAYVSGTGIDQDSTRHAAYMQNLRADCGAHLGRWEDLSRWPALANPYVGRLGAARCRPVKRPMAEQASTHLRGDWQ
jgi:pimeloyl-ACP methyl ester carboxylesterase